MKPINAAAWTTMFVGLAGVVWYGTNDGTETVRDGGIRQPAVSSFDPSAPFEDRIAALEQAVSDERQARQLLQEEVLILTEELERLSGSPTGDAEADAAEENLAAAQDSRAESRRRRFSTEGRIDRLIEAGFEPARAAWIVQRESELQMAALQERYDAERSGEDYDYIGSRGATSQQLRNEIGDADYERYLEANGRSTSIAISSVMASSPAQSAGLRVGDEIVSYDGQRIFSMTDLSRVTMEGEPGVNIVVDIVRDGTPMQVVLPRGPVGITTGRRFSR